MNAVGERQVLFRGLLSVIVTLLMGILGLQIASPVRAQYVSEPINRHTVINVAEDYVVYQYWHNGQWNTSMPYCWGFGDSILYLGPGQGACGPGPPCDQFQLRLDRGCDPTGCWNCGAGADCSGYVTRCWGQPISVKWGTWHISQHATLVPYANPQADLPPRMRMGDVFDDYADPNRHIVLLHYFDPATNLPHFYEEICPDAQQNSGWPNLWWNGVDGYRPYRYHHILDDVYLPDLRGTWYNWDSTLFIRDNASAASPIENRVRGIIESCGLTRQEKRRILGM